MKLSDQTKYTKNKGVLGKKEIVSRASMKYPQHSPYLTFSLNKIRSLSANYEKEMVQKPKTARAQSLEYDPKSYSASYLNSMNTKIIEEITRTENINEAITAKIKNMEKKIETINDKNIEELKFMLTKFKGNYLLEFLIFLSSQNKISRKSILKTDHQILIFTIEYLPTKLRYFHMDTEKFKVQIKIFEQMLVEKKSMIENINKISENLRVFYDILSLCFSILLDLIHLNKEMSSNFRNITYVHNILPKIKQIPLKKQPIKKAVSKPLPKSRAQTERNLTNSNKKVFNWQKTTPQVKKSPLDCYKKKNDSYTASNPKSVQNSQKKQNFPLKSARDQNPKRETTKRLNRNENTHSVEILKQQKSNKKNLKLSSSLTRFVLLH